MWERGRWGVKYFLNSTLTDFSSKCKLLFEIECFATLYRSEYRDNNFNHPDLMKR
jgi:hypothetical protein